MDKHKIALNLNLGLKSISNKLRKTGLAYEIMRFACITFEYVYSYMNTFFNFALAKVSIEYLKYAAKTQKIKVITMVINFITIIDLLTIIDLIIITTAIIIINAIITTTIIITATCRCAPTVSPSCIFIAATFASNNFQFGQVN